MGGYRIPNVKGFVSKARYEQYNRELQRNKRADAGRAKYQQQQATIEANRIKISHNQDAEHPYPIEIVADLMRPYPEGGAEQYTYTRGGIEFHYTQISRFGYPASKLGYSPNVRYELEQSAPVDVFSYTPTLADKVLYFTESKILYTNKPVAGFRRGQLQGIYRKYFSYRYEGDAYPMNILRGIESNPMHNPSPIERRNLFGVINDQRLAVVDVNVQEDLLSRDCVVKVLKEHMKKSKYKYLNSMTEQKLLEELKMENTTSGCMLGNLIAFCEKYKIDLRLCDVGFNVITR